jgi:hypothetical protein
MNTVLLLQWPVAAGADERVVAEARTFANTLPYTLALQACISLDRKQACVYAWTDARLLERYAAGLGSLARLATLSECSGVSARERAPYHYVVATDIEPAKEVDFNAWYRTEHLPGLAAVRGIAHCARFRSLESRPRYRAVYDLTAPEVVESDAWLAVRNTPWSARIRPHFTNTTRTLFHTVLDERASLPLAA